ncbi:MAG: helix-turn-helix transcriptional regulator [Nocardioides sp.]|nr:helix-turn-helix transcriptional regulator [Nocardioides sp.]
MTASFVSQLEAGRTNASVATLRRLADALGVLVAELFDPAPLPSARVVRTEEAVWETGAAGSLLRAVTHAPQVVEATWCVIPHRSSVGPSDVDIEANAETVILVVGGQGVSVRVADEEFVLERGDSLACESILLQSITSPHAEQAEVIALSSPPYA